MYRLLSNLRNPISLVGVVIVTASAVVFLILLLLDTLGFLNNPYIGLLVFVAVPLVFLLGLVLIPVGTWRDRRRRRKTPGAPPADWPVIDLRKPGTRTALSAILALTLANIVIVSLAAYGGIHYMEQAEFCGQVCHTPMQPQYTAYQDAPHSRVACVECHVGSGAKALVQSKVSGTRQLWQVATGNTPRPILSPVRTLRPARDTCEECHWPEKFHGDRTRVISEFANDAANTETRTTLVVHVGGGSERLGTASGIHWHMNLANEIEYVTTDERRDQIPYVRFKARSGEVREFIVDGTTPEQIAKGERRRMDCMDCHNRPAHTFVATPERAMDQALASGRVPHALPFVRREGAAVITADYPDQDAALRAIDTRLRQFYAPGSEGGVQPVALVDRAVTGVQQAYARNVFPSMRVTWGTYPNHLGHIDSPGCFRCHDDNHKAKDGTVIRQDCELCHAMP